MTDLTGEALDAFQQKLMAWADLDHTAAHSYLVVTALRTLLATAERELAEARADAGRYRYQRNATYLFPYYLSDFDEQCIDAAISGGKEGR